MEMLKRLEPIALLIMILGALNWGLIGLFDENVIANVFGTDTFTDVLYVIVGVSGLVYIPRLLEELGLGGHAPHPRGT
jgi:uncharacterized membrane protein YuzA (DUF378 family)